MARPRWVVAAIAASGLLLGAAGCSSPDATSEGTTTMPALWASSDKTQSGIENATVSITPDDIPGWSLDLTGEQADGAGPSWLAASGQAATMATLYSGVDPSSMSIAYGVTGPIDGPSAGGILTVGTLAALRGDQLLPTVTMTGTIEVDGSIGTVGGVDLKAEAARKAGFETMLVPKGLLPQVTPAGLTVIEVADIAAAYEAFTGTPMLTSSTPPAIAPAVIAEGEAQSMKLASVSDMGKARAAVIAEADDSVRTAPESSRTPEALASAAQAVNDDLAMLLDQQAKAMEEAAAAGTLTAGHGAALPAILAPAIRAGTQAQGAAEWAKVHPNDSKGILEAATVIARSKAVVNVLTPALLAVAATVPGPVIDSVKAESALRAYTLFEQQAADAGRDYIVDVFNTTSRDVANYPTLAALATSVRTLTGAPTEQTPGLSGAMLDQANALAAWEATSEGLGVLASFQGGSGAPSPVTTAGVTADLAAKAAGLGRDPSMALWMAQWAKDDPDAFALDLGATATASLLAATPKTSLSE